ncbi:energy transducer TonB [Rhizobium sp. LCM 4573]|uniref:energy transducer TonB family protein n=1 Tax=Rhizobium sp. LCM 4573 TaxID=1848291 RepID=UPI0008DA0506|nr:energy transducer TonB [Rhizobium sp. LCM 4573]OHV84386.1 hypothetical protein LCM4573_01525 [Rhizobium sp. LCM 4573]
MKNLAALALAVLVLTGCNTRKDAMVALHTDAHGKLSRVVMVRSTGDKTADEVVKRAAIKRFRQQAPEPKKNATYRVPAKVQMPPEPYWQ